jgi:GT2 family glycosyltransferase
MNAPKKISVIVPVYSPVPYLAAMFEELFLDGLRKESAGLDLELIIVDDASPLAERTAAAARSAAAWARTRYLRNEKNLGYLLSCNRGLREAGGDLLILCNSDTRFAGGSLRKLIAAAGTIPGAGLLGPVTNGAFGASAQSVNGLAPLKAFSPAEFARLEAFAAGIGADPPYRDVRWLLGFCVLIKRETLRSVGLLDENFGFGYQEEVDYGLRARKAGWRALVVRGAFVFHGGLEHRAILGGASSSSQTSGRRPLRMFWQVTRSLFYFWRKYGWKELSSGQDPD